MEWSRGRWVTIGCWWFLVKKDCRWIIIHEIQAEGSSQPHHLCFTPWLRLCLRLCLRLIHSFVMITKVQGITQCPLPADDWEEGERETESDVVMVEKQQAEWREQEEEHGWREIFCNSLSPHCAVSSGRRKNTSTRHNPDVIEAENGRKYETISREYFLLFLLLLQ